MFFRRIRPPENLQNLTWHIVEFYKKQSSVEIINETAICLKEILDYRLYAFVFEKGNRMNAWLDPEVNKTYFEDFILKDLCIKHKKTLTCLTFELPLGPSKKISTLDNLALYEIKEENYYSKVYMQSPPKKTDHHHNDIFNLILQGCSSALSHQLKIEELTNAAVIDPLTGCYNRREFENQLKRHIKGATRRNSDMSIFMFDIDSFKKINDTHGHPAGDKVLEEVGGLVKRNIRTGDILTRYGGDEFIVILPETDRTKAIALADRLRIKISNKDIVYDGHTINLTASFGVSQLKRNTEMTRIIQDADTMLYKAKLNGRNTVMPTLMKIVKI